MDRVTRRELHDLLSALLDGTLRPDQQDRLGSLLGRHAEARELYLAYFDLHAELALRGDVGEGVPAVNGRAMGKSPLEGGSMPPRAPFTGLSLIARPFTAGTFRWLAGVGGLCGLAAGILLLLMLWDRQPAGPGPSPEGNEPIDDTVAVLLRAPAARWEGTSPHPRPGSALAPGWLRLRSGLAHIEFYSGATVILEAPADLELISRTEAYCARGKLRATVPPHAQGFTIGTPKLELVDRGTEFGVYVGEGARTEVHVFQGKVELYDANSRRDASTRRELATGQGVRLDGSAGLQLIASAPAAFRTAQEVAARNEDETRRRHDAWRAASKAHRQDPTLLVYYPFETEQSPGRSLPDQGDDRRPRHDGTIVGCSWVQGRWPGKQALEFKRVSDRVRLHVPGTFDSITLVAWVRVDALPNVNNSLFMTDGWDAGGLHWQIGKSGKLVLGVRGAPGMPAGHYHARDVLRPERFGQWLQLAVVHDRDEGRVTHYVDGRRAGSAAIVTDVPLRIGNAEIGNWNIASRRDRQPIRNLSGCMDEFMLFSRALTAENIEELYAQGKRRLATP